MTYKKWKEQIKYPLGLFLFLFFAKVIYIIIESNYNYQILQIVTSPQLSREDVEALNDFGHVIASIGITLLLIPLYYFFFKRLRSLILYGLLILFSFISYFSINEGLNVLVEEIVEQNSDKRHNAYYTNIFKYGILNNHFAYDSFVPNEHVVNNALTINDKILITNTFLITFADKELINRLKEKKGREKISELSLTMNESNDYDERYNQFKLLSKELSSGWNSFNVKRNELNAKIIKLYDEEFVQSAYVQLKNSLKNKYIEYEKSIEKINYKIKKETELSELHKIEGELRKYFEKDKYKKAKIKYRESMYEKFGHYIEPKRWCLDGICPDNLSSFNISKVIREEIEEQFISNLNGIPMDLTFKEFLNNMQVKSEVAKELKADDILIHKDFDYSFKEFNKSCELKSQRIEKKIVAMFYKEFKNKIGENDIKLDYHWRDYVYSSYITNKIKENLGEHADDITIKRIQNVLLSKDIGNFRKKVYLPTIEHEIEKKLYTEKDFQVNVEAIKNGDEAIKLLYIPPFALALSMMALLSNFITVMLMLSTILPIKKSIKVVLFVILISIPFLNEKSIQNPLPTEILAQNSYLYGYDIFLNWLKFYISLNVTLQEKYDFQLNLKALKKVHND